MFTYPAELKKYISRVFYQVIVRLHYIPAMRSKKLRLQPNKVKMKKNTYVNYFVARVVRRLLSSNNIYSSSRNQGNWMRGGGRGGGRVGVVGGGDRQVPKRPLNRVRQPKKIY